MKVLSEMLFFGLYRMRLRGHVCESHLPHLLPQAETWTKAATRTWFSALVQALCGRRPETRARGSESRAVVAAAAVVAVVTAGSTPALAPASALAAAAAPAAAAAAGVAPVVAPAAAVAAVAAAAAGAGGAALGAGRGRAGPVVRDGPLACAAGGGRSVTGAGGATNGLMG